MNYFSNIHISSWGVFVLVCGLVISSTGFVPLPPPLPAPSTLEASYQFTPTGGAIVTGTAPAVLGATAAAAEGVNLGSWRAAIADDNLHFGINSTTGGYNTYLDLGGVQLNGANIIMFQTEIDLDATAPNTLVQVCDWVSSTGVSAAADAQCTGGGWRNLNLNDTVIAPTTATAYQWQIYDGYWNSTATAKISTPLSNFVSGSNTIRVRYFSTTNTTSTVHIDYLRAFAVVNPVYAASGAAVTASDGTGANILESTHAQIITVAGDAAPQTPTSVTDAVVPAPKPKPTSTVRVVERAARVASVLPSEPNLSIPLYPDDTWSNKAGPFLVEWPLPDDIIRVAAQISSAGSDEPSRAEGLFDAKTFASLADGVWYVHVQFKNSKGWGETAHRRIRVDTTPPAPFTVDVQTTKQYDPAPTFSFTTQDALSGIDHYVVTIDGTDTSVGTGAFTPSPLAPGAHTVSVRAVDAAGNQREANTTFTVLPLPLPSITHTNTPLFVGEAPLEVEGMAPSSNQVFLFARNKNGALIDKTTATTNSEGSFRATFGRLFAKGMYTVALVSETADGAQSLVITSDPIYIRERPLMTILGIGITQLWFFVVLLCMLVGAIGVGAVSHRFWYTKLRDRVRMAQRDTDVVFSMLSRDIEELLKSYKDHTITKREATKDEKRLKKVLDDLEKTHRYTKNNINEIIES